MLRTFGPLGLFVSVFCCSSPLAAQNPPAGFTYEMLTDGSMARVSSMCWLPDGRLLLAERNTGLIRVWKDGALQAGWLVGIPGVSTNAASEQGLLGIAADPDFLRNGFIYVYFTAANGTTNHIGRIRDNSGPGLSFTILTMNNEITAATYHNGGRMVFGRDGNLYVTSGDNNAPATAQNTSRTIGKVLRYSPPNMSVPPGNPFSNQVFSYGHRNMFGICVDPVSGGVFVSENGLNTTDELNRLVIGGNFGWPQHEGTEVTPDASTVDPIATWSPPVGPVGLTFYTGVNYPAGYQNDLFLVEYSNNRIRRITLDASRQNVVAQTIFHDQPLGNGLDISDGPDGNLYVLTNDSTAGRGGDELARYTYASAPFPGAHLSSVSRRMLGGSLTACMRANNGDVMVAWLSDHLLSNPLTTPFGVQRVPGQFVLPVRQVAADGRLYYAWSMPWIRDRRPERDGSCQMHAHSAWRVLRPID